MTYLMADRINGIWEVSTLEGEDCDVLTQSEFYEDLDTLDDGSLIGCEADAETCAKLEREYGIQFAQ